MASLRAESGISISVDDVAYSSPMTSMVDSNVPFYTRTKGYSRVLKRFFITKAETINASAIAIMRICFVCFIVPAVGQYPDEEMHYFQNRKESVGVG